MILPSTNNAQIPLEEMLALMDKDSQQSIQDENMQRNFQQQKQISYLDQSLQAATQQRANLEKTGKSSFWLGLASQFSQMITQALSVIFPPAAPAIQIAGQAIEAGLGAASQEAQYSFKNSTSKLQIKQQESQQLAMMADQQANQANDRKQTAKEHRNTVLERLEKSLLNTQEAAKQAVNA